MKVHTTAIDAYANLIVTLANVGTPDEPVLELIS